MRISFGAALVGAGFAGMAALSPDTGIEGTLGAFLTLLGAVTVTVTVEIGILLATKLSTGTRNFLPVIATLIVILTGLAAWLLMPVPLLIAMINICLTLFVHAVTPKQAAST